jgi:predicted MFS family arabinose efflux permease
MAISDDPRRDSDQPTMPGKPGRQRVVGRTPLYAVLSANAVSQVGDMMVAVALPWFVLQTTGSVVQMGIVGAVVGIGTLLSSISGGPLVDRFGFRRASVLSDVTAGAAVAAVPLLFWADVLPFWLLLTLALVISVLNAPGDLARRALVPTLAEWAAMPLERANAADTAIPRLSQLAGPLIGGVLVAVAGAPTVLLLDAATFLLSAGAVAVAVPSRAEVGDTARASGSDAPDRHQVFADGRLMRSPARQYLSELRDGFGFVRTSGLLISLIVIATVAGLLEKPLMSVVAPVYAQDNYGSAASFGAMLSSFGAGALAGTLTFSVVGHRLPRRLTFLACMLLAPAVMFGSLAATPPLPALLAALAVSGVIFGPMNSLFATAIQETTPTGLLGRVIGTVSALSMVGVPLGATVVGLVVAEVGLVATLVGMGGIYLALAVAMALNPALRAMDVRRVQA